MAMLKYLKQFLPFSVLYRALYLILFLCKVKYLEKEKDQYVVLSELCTDQLETSTSSRQPLSISSLKIGCSNFHLPEVRGKN